MSRETYEIIPIIKGYCYVQWGKDVLIFNERGKHVKKFTGMTIPDKEILVNEVKKDRKERALLLKKRSGPEYIRFLQKPDPNAPTELGWRAWFWRENKGLVSPHVYAVWESPELEAKKWVDSKKTWNVPGIHAYRLPRNWLKAGIPEEILETPYFNFKLPIVTGVVERFGRYALGKRGWRAEKTIIRELCAPDVKTMLKLIEFYPEVKVHLSPYAEKI